MNILLLGEYSNVHATLAEGLRQLGHRVTVASNGDFWKDYPRDIDLQRRPGKLGGLRLMGRMLAHYRQFKGYDVVQLINPMFAELKAERLFPIYRWLRRNNGKLVLGAFGMDYYWVHENITRKPLRYSDFNMGAQLRQHADAVKEIRDWTGTVKERLNTHIAADCDGIVAGLYEYWACYHPLFPEKTTFIPFPIKPKPASQQNRPHNDGRLHVFIGISRGRSAYKGTDIMLQAAEQLQSRYPDKVNLQVAEGVPFARYVTMMHQADCILDQLYSYTPSMNGLEAMSRGIVCVGGGEPENYHIIGEDQLRPIVNVLPTREHVYDQLEQLVLHPERVRQMQQESIEYIARHHDYLKVAEAYLRFYSQL